jgi:hypothetical protein
MGDRATGNRANGSGNRISAAATPIARSVHPIIRSQIVIELHLIIRSPDHQMVLS